MGKIGKSKKLPKKKTKNLKFSVRRHGKRIEDALCAKCQNFFAFDFDFICINLGEQDPQPKLQVVGVAWPHQEVVLSPQLHEIYKHQQMPKEKRIGWQSLIMFES